MPTIENSVTIRKPIGEVFAFVTTPENDPKWVTPSIEHRHTSEGPVGIGSTSSEVAKFTGRRAEYGWVVTEHRPPHHHEMKTTSGPNPIETRFQLEETSGATELSLRFDIELRGLTKIISPLLVLLGNRQNRKDLATLKRLLESA